MKLYGTMYELFEHQRKSKEFMLYRNDDYLPAGTAIDVRVQCKPGQKNTCPMTEHSGWGYSARPPTQRSRMACAYQEFLEVAFYGCVWHIGGGDAYNILPHMARNDGWYLVNPEGYPFSSPLPY